MIPLSRRFSRWDSCAIGGAHRGNCPRTSSRIGSPIRNLDWHRNSFTTPDPLQNNAPFCDNTPFISTTAGTVDRDTANYTNRLVPAWRTAL
jgi:hypothetical protein